MSRLTSYAGKSALITGASSGIGRLLALRLSRAGARVALVARRESELRNVAREIESVAARCWCSRAMWPTVSRCSHVPRVPSPASATSTSWSTTPATDITTVSRLGTRRHGAHAAGQLPRHVVLDEGAPAADVRTGRWVLVFVASVAGKLAVPDESAYVASKFAMVGLAETLSIELEDHGVHVLTVCPGTVNTPFFDSEALERMPPVARRMMIDPDTVVTATLDALARGHHEITVPRMIGAGYVVRAVARRSCAAERSAPPLGRWHSAARRPECSPLRSLEISNPHPSGGPNRRDLLGGTIFDF